MITDSHGLLLRALLCALLVVLPAASPNAASPLFQNLRTGAYQTVDQHVQEGRWLIVMIWAHDCEICEREVGDYQRFHGRRAATDATVLGVTLDGEERKHEALGFVARHGLEFDNLIGEPETVAAWYQITTGSRWVGTPSFLIFDPEGELKAKQAGAVEVEIVESFIAANSR